MEYRLITSNRYIDPSLKDTNMEKFNLVSTLALLLSDKDLAIEEQLP